MIKQGIPTSLYLELETADSGVGSTAPSEVLDITDHDIEFANGQEDGTSNLDPELSETTPISPKTSLTDVSGPTIPDSETDSLPTNSRCSTLIDDDMSVVEECVSTAASSNTSDGQDDMPLPPSSMASTCVVSFLDGSNVE